MKILVDAYWLDNGPPSGSMVLEEIINHWNLAFPDDVLVLALAKKNRITPGQIIAPDLKTYTKFGLHPLINGLELDFIARTYSCDIILAQNFAPLNFPSVTLIHDVLFQSNPEWFTRIERLYCSLMPLMASFGTRVITTTKTESLRIRKYNPRLRIGTPTGLAVSSKLSQLPIEKPNMDLQTGNFILTVGRLNVRKNLSLTCLGAIESGCLSASNPLVIVGEGSGVMERWPIEVQNAITTGHIIFTGYVADAQLGWLYQNCGFFCFLSLDEGFGLPPLEAISFGAKVLVSDIPVMRENFEDTVTYVDPNSAFLISQAFVEMDKSKDRRLKSISKEFDWIRVVNSIREEMKVELK